MGLSDLSVQASCKCLAPFRIQSLLFLFLQECISPCILSSKLGFLLLENILTSVPSGLEHLHRFNTLLCLKEWKGLGKSVLSNCYGKAVVQNREIILDAETTSLHSHTLLACLKLLRHSSGITSMLQKKATVDTVFCISLLRCEGVLWECLPDRALRALRGTSLVLGLNRRQLASCSALPKHRHFCVCTQVCHCRWLHKF